MDRKPQKSVSPHTETLKFDESQSSPVYAKVPVLPSREKVWWCPIPDEPRNTLLVYELQVEAKKYPGSYVIESGYFTFLETVLLPAPTWKQACW